MIYGIRYRIPGSEFPLASPAPREPGYELVYDQNHRVPVMSMRSGQSADLETFMVK